MESITVHVDRENFIILYCPYCDEMNRVSVTKFKNKKHTVTTRCKCKNRYQVQLNFRRYFRKRVKLDGEVVIPSSYNRHIRKRMTVCNISMSGLGFKLVDKADIKKGDTVRVTFDIETKRPVTIDKEAIVKFVDDGYFGCEFKNLSYEEKDLGFYMFG